jgi:LysM repeat protein
VANQREQTELEIWSRPSLKGQLHDMQNNLSHLIGNFAPVATVERLQAQVNSNQQKIADTIPVIIKESPEPPKTDNANEKTSPPHAVYHLVKKGENLYRIALRYGVDVNRIRELNDLLAVDSIRPNQKLLVR